MKTIIFPFVVVALLLCSCHNSKTNQANGSDSKTEMQDSESANPSENKITKEMALEGVRNYCRCEYGWDIDEVDSDMMYLMMGEETDSAYQVVFRSYTGAFVHFFVDKTTGATRMIEKVPSLNVEEEAGTINLFDYLDKQD